jgi:hypothetical protein
MSALAKKMMEKYGWKEGEGLGKDRSGMKSYVKVVRRDPNVATGLGHAADPAQGGSLASTHAVELDAIYGQLHKAKKNKSKKRPRSSSCSSSSDDDDFNDVDVNSSVQNSSSGSEVELKESNKKSVGNIASQPSRRQRVSSSDESSSGGSSDDESDDGEVQPTGKRVKGTTVSDVTRMTDKDLFQRCGGVRLGRAGRHRFFDGKLKRIHGSQ